MAFLQDEYTKYKMRERNEKGQDAKEMSFDDWKIGYDKKDKEKREAEEESVMEMRAVAEAGIASKTRADSSVTRRTPRISFVDTSRRRTVAKLPTLTPNSTPRPRLSLAMLPPSPSSSREQTANPCCTLFWGLEKLFWGHFFGGGHQC